MSGTSYAVTQLPENSVGSTQLKADAVTGIKVLDGSLTASDFAPGGASAKGASGPSTSAMAWSRQGHELPLCCEFIDYISLGQTELAGIRGSTGMITVTQASNLVVSASVKVKGYRPMQVKCIAQYSAASPVSWAKLTNQQASPLSFPPIMTRTEMMVPVMALQAVPAGTYDVRISCYQSGGFAGEVELQSGSLIVVATGQ